MGRGVDRRKRCKGVLSRVQIMGYPGMIPSLVIWVILGYVPGYSHSGMYSGESTRMYVLGYVPE